MNIHWEVIATIVVAIFGSTGFWNWLSQRSKNKEVNNTQLLEEIKLVTMNVKDVKKDVEGIRNEVDDLRLKVDKMESQNAERNAVSARRHIITFNEGLLRGERHSKEAFDQVLGDVDEYEKFCRSHPDFLNNKTQLSVEHIKNCYRKAEQDRDFL